MFPLDTLFQPKRIAENLSGLRVYLGPDVPDEQTPTNWRTIEGEVLVASFEEIQADV